MSSTCASALGSKECHSVGRERRQGLVRSLPKRQLWPAPASARLQNLRLSLSHHAAGIMPQDCSGECPGCCQQH